ncbi:hypothetical protein ALC62_10078 [Cyphomyrmex costatus]|uniref:Uncharacterized protein n=1 Tax=Cyphomyrmex costatus TaxID=456900 RepID=A0A195CE08_9HYME|nr:hypothetical protein ALC62_10078 [Cyphomyrmex costatus]
MFVLSLYLYIIALLSEFPRSNSIFPINGRPSGPGIFSASSIIWRREILKIKAGTKRDRKMADDRPLDAAAATDPVIISGSVADMIS